MDSPLSQRKPAKLSQSALDVVATEPTRAAYSPIVVSGVVRAIEFVADPSDRKRALFWLCRPERWNRRGSMPVRVLAIATLLHPRLPVGRALRHPRLPPPDQPDGEARFGVVDRLSARHGRHLLRKARRRIFPRLVRELLRLRPVRAAGFAPRALHRRAALDAARPADAPHRRRRRRRTRRKPDPRACARSRTATCA